MRFSKVVLPVICILLGSKNIRCQDFTRLTPEGVYADSALIGVDGRFLFFAIDDEHGREIWFSDGTPEETRLLSSFFPGQFWANIVPHRVISFQNNLFFETGNYPWQSPTYIHKASISSETISQLDFNNNETPHRRFAVYDFYFGKVINNTLFFAAETNETGIELWKTNGTVGEIVKDINGSPESSLDYGEFGSVNDQLLFAAEDSLYISDGTSAGTFQLAAVEYPQDFTPLGNKTIFLGSDQRGPEPWITDGSQSGTQIIKEILPGLDSYSDMMIIPTTLNNKALINGPDGTYATDGTSGGTYKVSSYSIASNGIQHNNKYLYFNRFDRDSLFATTGENGGTILLKTFDRFLSTTKENFIIHNNRVYFVARTNGKYNLWTSDGTINGTYLVKDINIRADGEEHILVPFGSKFYFSAETEMHGFELWESDGTEEGTKLIKEFNSGQSGTHIRDLNVYDGKFYLFADDAIYTMDTNFTAPCSLSLSIQPDTLFSNINSNQVLDIQSNLALSDANWEIDFGLGFQNLTDNAKYSGSSSIDSLIISDISFKDDETLFRVIGESGNCIDTSNIATVALIDTCITTIVDTITIYDTVLVSVHDTLIIDLPVSVNGQEFNTTIKIFPNPASDKVIIEFPDKDLLVNYSIQLLDVNASILADQDILFNQHIFDLTGFAKGLYYIRLTNPSGIIEERKKLILK